MAGLKPTLNADKRGVWQEVQPGHPIGIEWPEIYRVVGHKLDGITEVFTFVVLDFEYGKFIELYNDWPGFSQVVAAITERLPGIDPAWYRQIEQLAIGDLPVEVLRRK